MAVAIVTGASSGLGREFVRQLNESKLADEFWLVARRKEKMEEIKEEFSLNAKILCCDLASDSGLNQLKEELQREKPEVKFLINCAGFGDFGDFMQIPEERVKMMIDLNVKALVTVTNFTIPYIIKGGRIIELGSASCFTPLPYFNVYASCKAFVLHYTKALNYEIASRGITATCFCPGWVDTEFLDKATVRKDVPMPKKMKPLLNPQKIVTSCLIATLKGKKMYVTNIYTKFQHLLFKILPDSILSRTWLRMLNYPNKRK